MTPDQNAPYNHYSGHKAESSTSKHSFAWPCFGRGARWPVREHDELQARPTLSLHIFQAQDLLAWDLPVTSTLIKCLLYEKLPKRRSAIIFSDKRDQFYLHCPNHSRLHSTDAQISHSCEESRRNCHVCAKSSSGILSLSAVFAVSFCRSNLHNPTRNKNRTKNRSYNPRECLSAIHTVLSAVLDRFIAHILRPNLAQRHWLQRAQPHISATREVKLVINRSQSQNWEVLKYDR